MVWSQGEQWGKGGHKVPHGQPQPGLSGALECKLCWEGSQPRRGGDAVVSMCLG